MRDEEPPTLMGLFGRGGFYSDRMAPSWDVVQQLLEGFICPKFRKDFKIEF